MSIMLPGDLAWVLNLCGFMWPNVDEDKLRACAATDRNLAASVNTAQGHTNTAADIITTRNKGQTATAFGSHAKKVSVHLGNLKKAYEIAADALDAIADVVEGAKIAVIGQLVALAAEIAAAAAASIFTFGLSDAAGLAATALTKITLQQILDEMERQVIKLAEGVLVGAALTALLASVASLVEQETKDYVGTGHGVSVATAAGAGGTALAQSV
jgi:collagen type III alpha